MGKQLDWSDRGWTVKCEEKYQYESTTTERYDETTTFGDSDETTTKASTTTNAATTEFTASTTTKSDDYFNGVHNGCCKTWSVKSGEFLVYCTHKKRYAYRSDWWVYECIDGYTDYGYMGKSFV